MAMTGWVVISGLVLGWLYIRQLLGQVRLWTGDKPPLDAQKVDGFDPIASWRAVRDAVNSIRDGRGPVFLEFETYRLTGHTGSADYSYVPKDELERALSRDAAPNFREWLLANGAVSEDRLNEIERESETDVDEAFAYAESLPQPEADQLHEDVFADKRLVPDTK